MTRRNRPANAPHRKSNGEKNVLDPGAHPLDPATGLHSTRARRRVSGDGNMRLPHEHDETGDRAEAARGTQPILEQAADDAMSEREDTDRRGDAAVEAFEQSRRTQRCGRKA